MLVSPNSSSDLLHVVNPNDSSSLSLVSIKILQLFGTETIDKTNSIKAYYFHPDRTDFISIIASPFVEFSIKKKAILVKTDAYSEPLYVKMEDLSQILGIKKKVLAKKIKRMTPDEISSYLKMEVGIKKIQDQLKPGSFFKGEIKVNLLALSNAGIGLDNVVALVEKEGLSSKKMVKMLMELGETLRGEMSVGGPEANLLNPEMEPYRFYINGSNICIRGTEENGGSDFHINPQTLDFQIESGSKKIQELATQFNLDSSQANRNLNALAQRISYPTIEHILDTVKTDDDKKVMLNTFIHIGQDLRVNKDTYFKESKPHDHLEARAYGIGEQHIFIPGKKLGQGSFKLVNSAIKIDNFANQDFSNQVESFVRIKPNPKMISKIGLQGANEDLLNESEDMRILKDNPYAVESHIFTAYSKTGKIILFQKKYDGDGENLFLASVFHQLNALKELGMGLDLLHKKNAVHMDVKPPNFLLVGDIKNKKTAVQGKVADIGLLAKKGQYTRWGTKFYLPPEALSIVNGKDSYSRNYRADESADSYSYGITILETILPKGISPLKLDIPFFALEVNPDEFKKDVDGFLNTISIAMSKKPNRENRKRLKMLDVCRSLIKFDPKDRLTCGEAAKMFENIQLGIA